MRGTLKRIKDELRRRMHQPIPEQGRWLRQVVTGFFAYHAVPTNSRALSAFRAHVSVLRQRSLLRRSQKAYMSCERMAKLVHDWLPHGHIRHPWPNQRFDVTHPRWEPSARIGPLGSMRGTRSNARPYREPSSLAHAISEPDSDTAPISAPNRSVRPSRLRPAG
jgi:RNA-directed DNA polymerase